MALVAFRSKAAGEIFYFPEDARRLLEITGKEPGSRGIFTTDRLADAIGRLEAAIQSEAAVRKDQESDDADDEQARDAQARPVPLSRRAFPLLEMLRAARRMNVDVTWGV
jgi:hypothetical protein